jgi:hypothetical protein
MTRRLCSLLLLLTAPLGAAADQHPARLSFSATLESIKISGRPDEVVTRQFKLTLDPNQPTTHFKAHVEDWWRSEDGKQSFYGAPGTLAHSCAKWVSLNPVDAAVSASDTLTVRVTVSVPHELSSGGYWCALTLDEVPDPEAVSQGVGVRFLASVSTGVFVYVDPVERDATITHLDVNGDAAIVGVHNDGNAPLGIEGTLEFYAPGGTLPVATVEMARSTLLTEPSKDGTFSTQLPSATVLPSGQYRVRAILDFGADHYVGAERDVAVTRGTNTGVVDR